ncbi:unnamed protein product [Paramecium octaurelia]|uniref:Uncharacterized protein n=1 Tax=Paramecium octaurelia TaxID=43137 RepID=A0A8S1T209_PAROT|nr:unnamed protein product [Paramecium octaurelia]
MNPKYTYRKKQVTNAEKQQILKILGNNPTDKQIEYTAHENDLKTRTIKAWLKNKQQFCSENKHTSDSEDNLYNKRKTKEDKALFDYERHFNQNSNQYNYEITNSDLLMKKHGNLNDTKQSQNGHPFPLSHISTQGEKSQQRQQDKYALQNFESLALLLDQNDEIHQLISLFQNQERQIESIKKGQQDILEYMCSHLTKKPKRI